MMGTFWSQVKTKYPFNGRHLLCGAVGGLVTGLTKLAAGQATDLATTAGIASFVALSVGSWIGTELAMWNLRLAVRQISAMLTSVAEAWKILLAESETPVREKGSTAGKPSWGQPIRIRCIIDLPILLLILAPLLLLLVFLDLGYGLFNLDLLRPMALVVTFLALGSLIVQQIVLRRMQRSLARLALTLVQARESPPQSIRLPFGNEHKALHTSHALTMVSFSLKQEVQYWHQALHTAFRRSSWITSWIVDVSMAPTDLEGFPGPVS